MAENEILNESLEFYGKIRQEQGITITSLTREVVEGLVIYTAIGEMLDKSGHPRRDSATGAVSIEGLNGLAKADAFKSAETQAKGRLTISLAGVRYKAPTGEPAPEPAALDAPAVNNEKAEVVPEQPKVVLADVTNMPTVTEATLSNMHKEAEALSSPTVNPAEEPTGNHDPGPIAPPPYLAPQGGIFDDEPDVLVPSTLAAEMNRSTAKLQELAKAVTAAHEPVDAVLAAVQPATATGVTMPVPVPKPSDQPTRLQFQGFTIRCSKIVKQLNAAGKDAPGALMPYLRKVFNTKELSPETTSIPLWESTLTALETAGSPAAAFKILKG